MRKKEKISKVFFFLQVMKEMQALSDLWMEMVFEEEGMVFVTGL